MAIAYQTQYNAITAVQQYFTNTPSVAQYSAILQPLIIEAQTQGLAADPTATAFLLANRRFIINGDGVAHTLNYNGKPYVFAAGASYCVHPDEEMFFLAQALQQSPPFGIVDDPLGFAYFGGSGVARFFFF